MKQISNLHAFERISSNMAKAYGKIQKGEEEAFTLELEAIESNLLKTHRQDALFNGRRVLEAIKICLFVIDGYINDCEYDLNKFKTPDNEPFVEAILMAFDPFTNETVRMALENEYDLYAQEDLREYFTRPIQCLLRIEDSVEMWTKDYGPDGYFNFIEDVMGIAVADDDEMKFTIMARAQVDG